MDKETQMTGWLVKKILLFQGRAFLRTQKDLGGLDFQPSYLLALGLASEVCTTLPSTASRPLRWFWMVLRLAIARCASWAPGSVW